MTMQWQYNHYVLALVIVAAMSAAIAFFAWRRRPASGAAALTWLMLAGSEWALVYAVEMASLNPPIKVLLSQVMYIGVVSVPTMWFILTVQYTGRKRWLTRRNLVLLMIMPLCTLLLVWTSGVNDGHGLIWREIEIDTSVSPAIWDLTHGVFFWVYLAYSYLLVLSGSLLVFQSLIRSPKLYRGQAVALLIAALTPLAGNVLYVSGLVPFPGLDITPFAFALTGLAMAWALFYFRLLDVVPVAREAVIAGLADGVIVLDAQDRIVDLNPAAAQIIGHPVAEVIGQSAGHVLLGWGDEVGRYSDVTETREEIVLGTGEMQRTFDLRISPLSDRYGQLTGRLVFLHDITERRRIEEVLRRRAVQLQAASEVARDAAAVSELDELLSRTVNLIRERFGFYHVSIFLVDERGEYAVLRAATGEIGRQMLEQGYRLKVGQEGSVGYVAAVGLSRIALDVGAGATRFDDPFLPETRSEMTLPLRVGKDTVGALDVRSREAEAFDENDVTVLQTMADQLAVAIQNARLLGEMQHMLHELQVASGRHTREMWQAERPRGYRYRGLGVEQLAERPPEVDQAWQCGRPVTTPRPAAEGDGGDAIGSLAVPLKLRDQVLGVLNLRFRDEATSPEMASLVEELADRLALALESARLFEETQSRARREETIRQITEQMRRAVDVETILQTTIARLGDALGAPRVYVRLGTDVEELPNDDRAS